MSSYTPLRCCACNRPLLTAAHSVMTRSGVKSWGPKCFRRAFPDGQANVRTPSGQRLRVTVRRRRADAAQGELFEVAA